MHETVIVNTSPLFYLHKLGCIYIFEKLYRNIVIPQAVVNELKEGKTVGEDVPAIEDYSWITVKNVIVPAFIKIIPDLGNGEAEVLALGCQENKPLLVIDDALARRIAKLQEFKLTGTAGVLVKAKKTGHITQIKPLMDKLKEVGFYLKDELILEILKNASE